MTGEMTLIFRLKTQPDCRGAARIGLSSAVKAPTEANLELHQCLRGQR